MSSHPVSTAAAILALAAAPVAAQRATGIDVSDWQEQNTQGHINWTTVRNTAGKDFAFIRSSRGGTVGFYDEHDSGNLNGLNTGAQRYDDYEWEYNIANAIAVGMQAGPYHFARADILTYQWAGQTIVHTAADEANHMLQASGPWMKPGYMLPVFDFEAGAAQRTVAELSAYSVEFAERILAVKGIRPMVYSSSSYASSSEINSSVPAAMPNLWLARWPNQSDPDSIDIQNIDPPPAVGYPNAYGMWNPTYPSTPNPHPWKFWQYASTAHVAGIGNGAVSVDVDVAHGDIEFVKDYLVPALWVKNNSYSNGQWTEVSNWNSDQDPSFKGPAARLPAGDDTVLLDSTSYSGSITLESGTHNVRKLIVREPLNITGGSLSVNFTPTTSAANNFNAGTVGAQFSNTVTMSGGAFTVNTLQIDANTAFNLNGGTLTAATINLVSVSTSKINVGGDATLAPLSSAGMTINSVGVGGVSMVDLAGGTRTLSVNTGGSAAYDVQINANVTNGSLTKAGAGKLELTAANSMTGALSVNNGSLLLRSGGTLASVPGITLNTGGTLSLDNAATNNNNRIASVPITLKGGALAFVGNSGGTSTESGGSVTAASGASTIALSGTTPALSMTSLTRNAGATLNFTGVSASSLVIFTNLAADSFINQGTFVGGSDYAVFQGAGSFPGFIRAMTTGAGDSDYATSVTANRHVKITSSAIAVPTSSIYTLNLSGATVGASLASGATLTLSKGGVIKSGGGASSIAPIAAATITTGAATEYVFNTVAANDHLTVSVPITSGTGLTKTGLGTLSLSASNSYGGSTYLAQGTLRLGAANAIPNTSDLVFESGTVLDMNGNSETVGTTFTLGDVTTSANGALTLTGSNTNIFYNGLNSGATLSMATLNLGTVTGTSTFNVSDGLAANDLTVSSVIADGVGPHGLSKTGAGTLHLAASNTFTGSIAATAGTLSVSSLTALGPGSGSIGLGGGATPATFQYAGASAAGHTRGFAMGSAGGTIRTSGGGALTLIAAGIFGAGGPLTFDAASGNITVSTNISGTGSSLTKIGTGTLTLSASNTYTGTTTVNGGTLAYSTPNNLGSANSISIGAGTLRTLTGITESRSVALTSTQATIDTNGFNSTFSGNFSGSGWLNKIGTGTLTLTGAASSNTGLVTISDGILAVTANNQLGTAGVVTNMTVTVAGNAGSGHGGSLQLSGNVSYNLPLSIEGGGVNGVSFTVPVNSTGALDSVSGSNTWAGAITLGGPGTSGTDPTINQVSAQSGATLVLSGVISELTLLPTTLAKAGQGDLVLTGSSPNTYTNLTRLYAGRLIIEKDGALGAGTVYTDYLGASGASGNTFQLASSNSVIAFRAPASSPAGFTYNTNEWIFTDGGGTGDLRLAGPGQIDNLSGSNIFAGHIGLGGPVVSGTTNSYLGVSGGTLTLAGRLYTRGAAGARVINKVGPGTLVLSGDSSIAPTNTSAGAIISATVNVVGGTLRLNGTGGNTPNLPTVTAYNVSPAATLAVAQSNAAGSAPVNLTGAAARLQTAASLTLASNVNLSGAGAPILDSSTFNSTLAGTVSGSTGLQKDGSGKLTLSGTISGLVGGNLNVNQGTLALVAGNTNARTTKFSSLSINPAASLDIADNKMVVQFGTGASPLATIRQYIVNGRGGTDFGAGDWQGTGGIASSSAAAGDLVSFAVGYVENSFLPQLGLPSYTNFGGQNADSGSMLIRYTKGADVNLDGKVNTDDVTILGATYNTVGSGQWFLGDFDYDGIVDSDDVTVLGALYDATAPALSNAQLTAQYGGEFASAFALGQAMGSSVPEPSACALLGLAAGATLHRRRRISRVK